LLLFAYIGSGSAFANPAISTAAERPQPAMFEGKLKGYQLKVCCCVYYLTSFENYWLVWFNSFAAE